MLAYHQSSWTLISGHWSQTPGAWLSYSMRRDFNLYIIAGKAGKTLDPRWRVVRRLLQIRDACSSLLRSYKQSPALGCQAVMMFAGRFDAALTLPFPRPAQTLFVSKAPLVPQLPDGFTAQKPTLNLQPLVQVTESDGQQLQSESHSQLAATQSESSLIAEPQVRRRLSHGTHAHADSEGSEGSSIAAPLINKDSRISASTAIGHMAELPPRPISDIVARSFLPASVSATSQDASTTRSDTQDATFRFTSHQDPPPGKLLLPDIRRPQDTVMVMAILLDPHTNVPFILKPSRISADG